MKECFSKISSALASKLNTDVGVVEDMLLAREKDSSTALSPGLAIPHIVVGGSGVFELLLIRCGEGIIFPDVDQPVHALFALFGSSDERNFHLTSLMAIAQITQQKDFLKKWLRAKNVEELKTLVLLGKRKRGLS